MTRLQYLLLHSRLGRWAALIGFFVMVYVSIGFGVILALLGLGVNPTLVVSVVAAPIWVVVLILALKLAKAVVPKSEIEDK